MISFLFINYELRAVKLNAFWTKLNETVERNYINAVSSSHFVFDMATRWGKPKLSQTQYADECIRSLESGLLSVSLNFQARFSAL